MDELKIQDWAFVLGIEDEALPSLRNSGVEARKASIFASTAKMHGLQVWIKGPEIHLLDEKGFLCFTDEPDLAFLLVRLESIMGPGAVRKLLSREPVDPFAAVAIFAPIYRRVPQPVKKSNPSPKASSQISQSVFESLLKDL